jgi:hypothetical protein
VIGHFDVVITRDSAEIAPPQRQADVGDGEFVRQSHDGAEDMRHDMRVLVGIEMSWHNPGRDNLLDLCAQLAIHIKLLSGKYDQELARSFRKRLAGYKRSALHQNQMAADVKGWILSCEPNGVVESVAGSH